MPRETVRDGVACSRAPLVNSLLPLYRDGCVTAVDGLIRHQVGTSRTGRVVYARAGVKCNKLRLFIPRRGIARTFDPRRRARALRAETYF